MYALSLIPILVAFIGVVKTKKAFESCIAGIFAAIIIYAAENGEWNLPVLFYNFVADTSSTPGNMWVIIFTLAIGAVTQLMSDSGATKAFTNWVVKKFANNSKKSLFSVVILAIVVYADEFLKAAVLDDYGKAIGRKSKLPIEVIAMMIVALGIPLVSWMPYATWSVWFAQLMGDSGFTTNATGDFITKVMPIMFFPMILTVIMILFAAGKFPALGTVKEAMRKVEEGTYDFSVYGEEREAENAGKATAMDFIIPLALLLGIGIYNNGDLAVACMIVILFEIIWYVARGIMTFDEAMKSFWNGNIGVLKPTIYLMVGFTLTSILKLIGFPELIQAIANSLIPGVVLVFFFVAACAIGTLTGMFWPTTSMFMAACLPITESMGISPFVLSAVLFSAATLGTVISPRGALVMFIGEQLNSNPVDIIKGVRPYAMIAGVITIVIYLFMGFAIV